MTIKPAGQLFDVNVIMSFNWWTLIRGFFGNFVYNTEVKQKKNHQIYNKCIISVANVFKCNK